ADYLGAMRAPIRKQIRKERLAPLNAGLTIEIKHGNELSDADWKTVYALYRNTTLEKGGEAYLQPSFFVTLAKTMGENLLVFLAKNSAQEICAMSLCLSADNTLYGRYWGCANTYDKLHFELCYYAPIEWALQHGIDFFQAGAQGYHKIKRGFLATPCHSSHLIFHPGLQQAVADFLKREQIQMRREIAELNKHSPFKADT